MKRLCTAVLPGALLLSAALLFLRPGTMPAWVDPYLRAYPFVVVSVGGILGSLFNCSRIVFAILVLALADRALLQSSLGHVTASDGGHIVFGAVAILLPLNIAALAMISERGILNRAGLSRLLPIMAQSLLVGIISLPSLRGISALLDYRFVDGTLMSWTHLSQPALLAFVFALLAQAIRLAIFRSAIEAGFFWGLVASFLALHNSPGGITTTNYFATAGLILVVGIFEQTYRMAYHDDLTGLPGRRALNEALPKLGARYALAMVDIDHFKQFNDRYGHDVGDQVLRMVASKLERVSGGGKAYRYGGEEFAVVFPGQSSDEAIPHLESLRRAVQSSCFVLRGKDRPRKKPKTPKPPTSPRKAVVVTVSIGVGQRGADNLTPEQVIKAADNALYKAKDGGRNRTESWAHSYKTGV